MYQKINHPQGDDYENWLAAEQAVYYRKVIVMTNEEDWGV